MDVKTRRSRSDPSVSLKDAVEKIRILYDKEKRNEIPFRIAMDHLGYRPKSGSGFVLIADLRKYGLLGYKGAGPNKMVIVSDLAENILHPGSPTRKRDLQKAALMPLIYAQLWENHSGSTDENLSYFLTTKRHYSEETAKELIKRYRESIEYAGLSKNIDTECAEASEEVASSREEEESSRIQSTETAAKPSEYTLYASLGVNKRATVVLPMPMTKEKWEKIKMIFDAQIDLILGETNHGNSG